MLKGQDLVVLAAMLANDGSAPKLPDLSSAVSLGLGPVHRSLSRLEDAGLVSSRRRAQFAQADEFFAHALRYVFPPRMKGETRGIPTSWAAPPLRERLASPEESLPLVWAHPSGSARGIELEPLHAVVPEVALRSPELYELLALIDALRSGDARIRGLAHDELRKHFVAVGAR